MTYITTTDDALGRGCDEVDRASQKKCKGHYTTLTITYDQGNLLLWMNTEHAALYNSPANNISYLS